jgi:hypothetical protein
MAKRERVSSVSVRVMDWALDMQVGEAVGEGGYCGGVLVGRLEFRLLRI